MKRSQPLGDLGEGAVGQGFSTLALLTFWTIQFCVVEDCLVHCVMFSSITGLNQLDTSSGTPSPS